MTVHSITEAGFNLKIIPVTVFDQNAMIFWSVNSGNGVLIDPGGDIDEIMQEIETLGINITAIWLTHGHVDHCGGASACRKKLACKIIGPHKDDQFLLDELESNEYGIEEAENFTPDMYLDDGDTIALDDCSFQIIHCPGHSPGSVVMYNREHAFAFMGDVLFAGSIGRTDLKRSNPQDLISSIAEKLWPLQDQSDKDIAFFPGHGPSSSFGRERQSNPFVADSVLGK